MLTGRRVSPEAPQERRETGPPQGAMWYVYFLQLSNGDIYVGSTNDLRRRVSSHEAGQVISTKGLRPVVLRSYLAVEDEPQARALERYFKSGSGKAFANKRLWRSARARGQSSPLE